MKSEPSFDQFYSSSLTFLGWTDAFQILFNQFPHSVCRKEKRRCKSSIGQNDFEWWFATCLWIVNVNHDVSRCIIQTVCLVFVVFDLILQKLYSWFGCFSFGDLLQCHWKHCILLSIQFVSAFYFINKRTQQSNWKSGIWTLNCWMLRLCDCVTSELLLSVWHAMCGYLIQYVVCSVFSV